MRTGAVHGPFLYVHDPEFPTCYVRTARAASMYGRAAHWIAERRADVRCSGCTYLRGKQQYARRKAVRGRPELPPGDTGVCRFCETPLTGRRTSWCSDACGKFWLAVTSGPLMLAHLVDLHGYQCWECGEQTRALDVDHVRPLWSLTDEERTQIRWWLPYNLQLLCAACHKTKTRREAGERAAVRRAARAGQ